LFLFTNLYCSTKMNMWRWDSLRIFWICNLQPRLSPSLKISILFQSLICDTCWGVQVPGYFCSSSRLLLFKFQATFVQVPGYFCSSSGLLLVLFGYCTIWIKSS
jgi:hypothetical protein